MNHINGSAPEPRCSICGAPLADNWLSHSATCDTCARYRPAPPEPDPPIEPDPCVGGRLYYPIQFRRAISAGRSLPYAA
jgi:hypothetical protein